MNKVFKSLAFLICLLMMLTFGLAGQAAEKPSDWAEAEVASAIDHDIVPEQLQKNYQSNIKRCEYVLIALKVFDKTGKNIVIADNAPFSDTKDHTYETEIIRAYNAGIIKGDGKGHFFPDNFITREEIASLVVNLLKQIAPTKDYTVKNKYTFVDSKDIGDWAGFYIDYCYENKILNGYSGNRMDPKGNATIEQSIALLYRLANSEKLLDSAYGTIQIYDEAAGNKEVAPNIINRFVENYSVDTFNALKQLSENKNIAILSLGGKSATLSVNSNTIMLNDEDNQIDLAVLIHDANDELLILSYKQLLGTFKVSEQGIALFAEYVTNMKANEWIDSYTAINETTAFLVETLRDVSGKNSYMVTYKQK